MGLRGRPSADGSARRTGRRELRSGRGRNFKVVELNGVTSEATHIYDPANGLLAAYRVLFKQWRLAFEIGALCRARGARVTPLFELLTLTYRGFYDVRGRAFGAGREYSSRPADITGRG